MREIVSPTPLSRQIVDTLRQKGYTLVLATNPLFPPQGVRTRLAWVDLLPEDFSLVTTYDNSTFCKPCPGYYREILKKLGKQAEQCRMVGNNPLDDMDPPKRWGWTCTLSPTTSKTKKICPPTGIPRALWRTCWPGARLCRRCNRPLFHAKKERFPHREPFFFS